MIVEDSFKYFSASLNSTKVNVFFVASLDSTRGLFEPFVIALVQMLAMGLKNAGMIII